MPDGDVQSVSLMPEVGNVLDPFALDGDDPLDCIIRRVCRRRGVTRFLIYSRNVQRDAREARAEVWSRLREYGWSWAAIGREFRRDPKTIAQVVQRSQRRREYARPSMNEFGRMENPPSWEGVRFD